jgi:hypothetical protein
MHASFEQLLNLRDGRDTGDGVAAHVRSCPECHATLDRLNIVTVALRKLQPRFEAPDRWNAIVATASGSATEVSAPRSRPGWLLPAASAALVVVAVLLTFGDREPPAPAAEAETATTVPAAASREHWLAESQRLESLLASLPAEPRVTRAQTELTVADLEDRLQWVDYRLNLASEAGLAGREADLLWRERVDLLNSLVAVRYAQTRTVAF